MSIAGKRAGLGGSRSVLFMEYIRVVKEMRKKHGKPRYMVWENVPGAFSSNGGEDFRCVLEEIAGIAEDGVSVPGPPKGKWKPAGGIMGNGWSLAWRILDAQYWGVPQRRKRIYLVADFGGNTAGKILFKWKGLRRDTAEGRETWQGTTGDIAQGISTAVGADVYNKNLTGQVSSTIGASYGKVTGRTSSIVLVGTECYDISDRRRVVTKNKNLSPTLTSKMGSGGNNVPVVLEKHPQDCRADIAENGIVQTLTGRMGSGGGNVPLVMFVPKVYGICSAESNAMKSSNPDSGFYEAGTSRTIDCRGGNPSCNQGGMAIVDEMPVYAIQGNMVGRDDKNGPQGCGINDSVSFTLTSTDHHAVAHQIFSDKSGTLSARMCKGTGDPSGDECQNIVSVDYAVRRFTPLECGRLQGFPDGWTDGLAVEEPSKKETRFWQDAWAEWWALIGRDKGIKRPKDEKAVKRWLKNPVSDTALYKMWGNGIALPCALYVFEGIAEILKKAGAGVPTDKTQ